MAVDSGTSTNQMLKSPKKKETKSQNGAALSSPAKRNKSPGIRLIGGRIYDPVNGKTCHQCRQKTTDFVAACKNQKNHKTCTIMFCHKCLLNRYGEKAEEVNALGEWSCPRCRGICNCSICMKKRGHQPTGLLVKTAKATGYSSVSEMLLKGGQPLNREKVVAVVTASPKKEVAPSPRKRGKENSFDGKIDANLPNDIHKKSKKDEEVPKDIHKKSKKDKEVPKDNKDDVTSISQSLDERNLEQEAFAKMAKQLKRGRSHELENKKGEILNEKSVNNVEKNPKKSRKVSENDDSKSKDVSLARRTSPRKISNNEAKLNVGVSPDEIISDRITVTKKDLVKPLEVDIIKEDEINTANVLAVLKQHKTDPVPEKPMPLGTELNCVAGIDVSTEDVGNALQFLEFCAAFGKALEVKRGQAEHVLQDLFHGRVGRRGKFSVTVQFHIQLLSILQAEQGEECGELSPSVGKSSWFNALKKCLSESQSILKAQGLECLDRASDYESLGAPEKLRLLNFLCDEILETDKARSWIDEQNAELAEKAKEARKKVTAAKDEEKNLKQKLKDDIAKAIIAKHGAPLTISEHEAIVSLIKQETAEAHAKVLESKGILLENCWTCNAVRIEPVLVPGGGNVYWKLSCSGNSNVLRQDVGNGDTLTLNEKWFAIDDEGKEVIEKHMCSLRGKKQRF